MRMARWSGLVGCSDVPGVSTPGYGVRWGILGTMVLGMLSGIEGGAAWGQTVPGSAPGTMPKTAAATMAYKDTTLAFEERVADLVGRMTLEEKAAQVQMEGIHGMARAGNATVFPEALALAASWDTALLRKVG